MALVSFVRRLSRAQPAVLLPQLLSCSLAHHILSPPHSSPSYYFSESFRQAVVTSRYSLSKSLHFSTDQNSQNRKLYKVFDFNDLESSQESSRLDVSKLIDLLGQKNNFQSGDEALDVLDNSGVKPSEHVIISAIWALKEEWKLAFLVYKWGQKWNSVAEKTWCLMIWVLGNHKKFGTAWSLIHDLLQGSLDTRQALLILIDRYASANQSSKAIQTFQFMEKFSLSPDQTTFFTFLNILCTHGNVEEAEEFMLLSKRLFPLDIEGFNIILNGWCNVTVDIFEAKRIWREMSKCCILPDGTSYAHMISCFSKVGNLFDSLRLYDEMKKKGFIPSIEVYNSLAYILARENCLKEALSIIDKIKEAGLFPDSMTYNSMIHPLCKAGKINDARDVLSMMLDDGIKPTVDTYHAFLQDVNSEKAFEVIKHMKKAGLGPNSDTVLLILRKLFELEEPDSALKLWQEMKDYGLLPDSVHYTACVEGLAKCGLLVKAREFYAEMRSKGISSDAKLEKLLKEPGQNNSCHSSRLRITGNIKKGRVSVRRSKSSMVRKKTRHKS